MKTYFYSVIFIGIILVANVQTSLAQGHTWNKSETGIWKAKKHVKSDGKDVVVDPKSKGTKEDKVLSFKIDTDYIVWSSADEKKWEQVHKGMWTDFEGNVYRAHNKMFFVSKDGGETWDNTPGAMWHGGDGVWYKFDDNWGLWVSQQ